MTVSSLKRTAVKSDAGQRVPLLPQASRWGKEQRYETGGFSASRKAFAFCKLKKPPPCVSKRGLYFFGKAGDFPVYRLNSSIAS